MYSRPSEKGSDSVMYRVMVEESAERDLTEILLYFTETLNEHKVAAKTYNMLRSGIAGLSDMPHRAPYINEEPYRMMGIRKLIMKNHIAIFLIDEKNREVHVIRVLHVRREWQDLI